MTGKQTDRGETESLEPYSEFSSVYDRIMDHVPYEAWSQYLIRSAIDLLGRLPDAVLDLGCGTGRMLALLSRSIPNLFGLDRSQGMLRESRNRLNRVRFSTGRLEGPFPYGSNRFPWIISTHDSLNYLLRREELEAHFREVARILLPGGVYSFDVVSLVNILEHHNGRRVNRKIGDRRMIWTRNYDPATQIIVSGLEFRGSEGVTGTEVHRQRYYSDEEVLRCARGSDLNLVLTEGNYRRGKRRRNDTLTNFHFRKGS